MLRIMHVFCAIAVFLHGVIDLHQCFASSFAHSKTQNIKQTFSSSSHEQDDDKQTILAIESNRILIIDSAEWETRNPSKALSFSERAITLRDAVFNIPANYEVPIKNVGSVPLTIDSITLSGSLTDFILDTNYKKTVRPGDRSNINIQFLHNTTGDVECTFVIHTNLKQVLPGIIDSIANPSFVLSGKVNRGNLDISENGCKLYYLNTNSDTLCQCKNVFTFLNNGQANIILDSIVFSGDSKDFIFKPNDLKARRILGPNQSFVLEVIPNPKSKDTLEYPGKIIVYSNAPNSVPASDVSYKTVQPAFRLSSTDILAKTGETATIPINFSLINYPGDKIAIIDSLLIEFPEESRHAMSDIRFTLDEMISPLNDTNYYIIEDSLNASPINGQKRFYTIYRNPKADPKDPKWYLQDKIGKLSFNYFLNEHGTIQINIKKLRVMDQFGRCYSALTLQNVPITIQSDDEFCLESLNDFFRNIRTSTNDFIASMKVSGEPVMEIQHFFKESTFAQISLYSVNGMKLETVFSGMAPAELHQFRHPMSHLPPGVYFCEMVAGQFHKTIPIILNR